ncbi:hypothetical protein [Pseudoclavibacter helvolus]|uniref:hypothetical protein n=1 Tax=Pseudoclavibacter helvolus TaxID=255205 RepID=UPI003C72A714
MPELESGVRDDDELRRRQADVCAAQGDRDVVDGSPSERLASGSEAPMPDDAADGATPDEGFQGTTRLAARVPLTSRAPGGGANG